MMEQNPRALVLDKGFVELVRTPNSDLKVVNSARVSFHKKKESVDGDDLKLIRYLAKNNHWTPFAQCRYTFQFCPEHTINDSWIHFLLETQDQGFTIDYTEKQFTISGSLYGFLKHLTSLHFLSFFGEKGQLAIFDILNTDCQYSCKALLGDKVYSVLQERCLDRDPDDYYSDVTFVPNTETQYYHKHFTFLVKAPIFVRTQLFKHKIGFVENEVSRRYVTEDPVFYEPTEWRSKPEKSIKQGSGDVIFRGEIPFYKETLQSSKISYEKMNEMNICAEQARGALCQSMYTEWYWTASEASYDRMINLRTDPHAQKETRDYAIAIGNLISQENTSKNTADSK